jgi:hypothetical protein
VHTMKMAVGKTYQIDLKSRAFDSFLRLENSSGKQLAEDDDGGGNLDSRIIFKATKDDTYRIVVTSFDGKSGDYKLTVIRASETAAVAASALQKAQAEQQKGMQAVNQEYFKAKTQEEKDQVLNRFFESAGQYVERFAKIAQDYPKEAAGTQALQMARQSLAMVSRSNSPATVKILRNLMDKSPHPSLQGQAAVALGQVLRNQYEKAYQDKDKKASALYAEAEKTLTGMSEKFADDSSLKNQFKDALFELQVLSIGKTAPEIEGEDLDGKKFKLSDYRGKVVVLDFWGNW